MQALCHPATSPGIRGMSSEEEVATGRWRGRAQGRQGRSRSASAFLSGRRGADGKSAVATQGESSSDPSAAKWDGEVFGVRLPVLSPGVLMGLGTR